MESGHLFHLASIAKPCPASKRGTIKASAAHMVFAGRTVIAGESSFISPETVAQIEPIVGKACLDALVEFEISVSLLRSLKELGGADSDLDCHVLFRIYILR